MVTSFAHVLLTSQNGFEASIRKPASRNTSTVKNCSAENHNSSRTPYTTKPEALENNTKKALSKKAVNAAVFRFRTLPFFTTKYWQMDSIAITAIRKKNTVPFVE